MSSDTENESERTLKKEKKKKEKKSKKDKKHKKDKEKEKEREEAKNVTVEMTDDADDVVHEPKSSKRSKRKRTESGSDSAQPSVESSAAAAGVAAVTASAAVAPSSPAPSPSFPPFDESDSIRLFTSSSSRTERMILHAVTDQAAACRAVQFLSHHSILGVDCEGVSLSRSGELCLIQLSTPMDPLTHVFHVFLFDVVALGSASGRRFEALDECGLAKLLSDAKVKKLFFDVRRDSESLFHQHGVRLAGVLDIQLLEISHRRLRGSPHITYLPGLGRLLADKFRDLEPGIQAIKEGMSAQYADAPDLWRRRPLTQEQLIYAAVDVALLHLLLADLTTPPPKRNQRSKQTTDEDVAMKEDDEKGTSEEKNGADVATTSSSSTTKVIAEAASTNDGVDASAEPQLVSRPRRQGVYVTPETCDLVEQYTDVIWAASTRDSVDGEVDMWSRRHVPLDFHHASFPLSLRTAVELVWRKQEEERRAKEEEEEATKKKKKKKGKKDKTAETVAKIDPTFNVLAAAAPTSAAATDGSGSDETSTTTAASSSPSSSSSLSAFVQRLTRTPVARNNYSGLAGTLKAIRARATKDQNSNSPSTVEGRHRFAPVSMPSLPAAPTSTSTSTSTSTPSKSSSKQAKSNGHASNIASSATNGVHASPLSRHPVNAHVGDPHSFHPQLTQDILQQHAKMNANQHAAAEQARKKAKISHAF